MDCKAKCADFIAPAGGQLTAKDTLIPEDPSVGERIRTTMVPISTFDRLVSTEREAERRDFQAFCMLKPA
jgi:hypothetical protein